MRGDEEERESELCNAAEYKGVCVRVSVVVHSMTRMFKYLPMFLLILSAAALDAACVKNQSNF